MPALIHFKEEFETNWLNSLNLKKSQYCDFFKMADQASRVDSKKFLQLNGFQNGKKTLNEWKMTEWKIWTPYWKFTKIVYVPQGGDWTPSGF